MVKLAQHSEGPSSMSEVNHEVVHRNNVLLLGEASVRSLAGFQSTGKVQASVAVMLPTLQTEESAEAIVVAIESVSNCTSVMYNEECGKLSLMKSQTEEEETTGGAL